MAFGALLRGLGVSPGDGVVHSVVAAVRLAACLRQRLALGRRGRTTLANHGPAGAPERAPGPFGIICRLHRARTGPSTDGGRLSAATVIIQYTTVGTSRFAEAGARPPYARTTGSAI